MPFLRGIGSGLALCWLCAASQAQQPAPLADRVENPLLPTGISDAPAYLDAELAYLFQDEQGIDVVHLLGNASVRLGNREGLVLRAREVVVWINPRKHEGREYHHLRILLWGDAEVREAAGTLTSSPALFVTLNSFGKLVTSADEVAFQSSVDTQAYREGDRIRQALIQTGLPGPEDRVALRVFDATGLTAERKEERPPFDFTGGGDFASEDVGGRRMITFTGGVVLSQGLQGERDFIEIRADSAVLILGISEEPEQRGINRQGGDSSAMTQPRARAEGREPQRAPVGERPPVRRAGRTRASERQLVRTGFGEVEAEAVYLEGDVVMAQGPNTIRASRLYYDWVNHKAIILDAVIRTTMPGRNVPLYLRAARIQQLSQRQYAAEDAALTTSEFKTPHYHVGARRILLTNRTPTKPTGEGAPLRAGSFRINHATLNIAGVPVGYWPFVTGRVDISETSMKSMRLGYSGDFGVEIETDWHFFNLAGLETPEGFDATLSLDFFSERGPAAGLNVDYERDKYYGLLRSYLLTESGTDSLGRDREAPTKSGARSRFLLRHRQFLEDDWQLTFELSYITDRNFLEEWFEREFDTDKEQETLLYLKKQRDNWAFTTLLQWRILDWLSQTESLPDFSLRWMGPSPIGLGTLFSENRLGVVRYRPGEQTFREFLREGRRESSGTTTRVDTRQELEQPIDLGPVRIVPFASLRGSGWDESRGLGGVRRFFGSYGIRGSLYGWKGYPDFESQLLDMRGLRHIVKADFIGYASHTNVDSHQLYPFDELTEGIDEFDGFALGIRQRFQTKRGQGETRRTVDVLTIDTECGFFNDVPSGPVPAPLVSLYRGLFDGGTRRSSANGFTSLTRPENGIPSNYLNNSIIWRINDRTALVSESNYDLNDGEIDVLNVSFVVDRPPRLSYLIGYRFFEETESNLLAFGANYCMDEKHTLALRELFDLDRGTTLDFTVGLVQKLPRWYAAVAFRLDKSEDDFGVSFSLWPQGLPSAAFGSRRFTGLATSTRLENN